MKAEVTKTCETCRHAIYDHEEYFGSPAGRLSDCRKIDEMAEGEAEVFGIGTDCPFYESDYDKAEEEYIGSLMFGEELT